MTSSAIQLIGMSATLPNLESLANWLDAQLYQTNYRPISLIESIKFENNLIDKNGVILKTINVDTRIDNDPDLFVHLVLETIVNKLGVLVFCPTKARCEILAENIARTIFSIKI
jgi:DNA polymerase theta